ncbi:MAG: hypothetical protein M1819_000080 [Sarea resinae]|nr:MAG: hypothetical protein M1819_000080 [Sarea resinae]
MTKRKKEKGAMGQASLSPELDAASASTTTNREKSGSPAPSMTNSRKSKTQEPSTSALVICRNKHWRYISSFHGPWLQLPPEVLESLAHSNILSPRPHPIDPAVLYDLVKIRHLVDEATNLAVRAASGVTSSSLNNSFNASNGMLGGGGAAALGLGLGGGGGNAKLSRERKHRMRELATQRLSRAYHLDEIAASVATMQSASSLEDVANLVLQRNATDSDAKYVHFFHEKIPSRMLAKCTSLRPLDEVIADRPSEGAPLRTRAATRVFKDDYLGAAKDLTEALAICRYRMAQHKAGRGELELASVMGTERRNGHGRDWRQEVKIDEEDQPSSLEDQLLFHRAGAHLTIACQHVDVALEGLGPNNGSMEPAPANGTEPSCEPDAAAKEAQKRRLEARKIVKTYAKRALKDYIAFLSHFDYTPGLPAEHTEEFLHKVSYAATGLKQPPSQASNRALQINPSESPSTALVTPGNKRGDTNGFPSSDLTSSYPALPPTEVYQISSLFSASPPSNLPPYPCTSLATITSKDKRASGHQTQQQNPATAALLASLDVHEALTYHPLLTDALHSLLLCHALIQTSSTELLRHAHNVARLARLCDGYPVFLAARSPARADWIEILHRSKGWLDLRQSWESLCAPAPLPGQGQGQGPGQHHYHHAPQHQHQHPPNSSASSRSPSISAASGVSSNAAGEREAATGAENQDKASAQQAQVREQQQQQARERRKQAAILEALADERVHDQESFQAAVRARERRAEESDAAADIDNNARCDADAPATITTAASASTTTTLTLNPPPPPSPTSAPVSSAAPGRLSSSSCSSSQQPPASASASASTPTQMSGASSTAPKRWAQEDGKEYPISTERADAVARWVRDAPLTLAGADGGDGGSSRKKKARGKGGKAKAKATAEAEAQANEQANEQETETEAGDGKGV